MNEALIVSIQAEIKDFEAKIKTAKDQLEQLGAGVDKASKKTTSGFNGLSNSINQVTREIPAFTYSAQTGFLALSNNIPILIDEINRLSAANKALASTGQPTTSVFKQIASSIFSLQTAMMVGISLVVIYGKEIGDFFAKMGGNSSIDSTKEKLDALNQAYESKSVLNAIRDFILLKKSIEDAKKGTIDSKDVIDKYNGSVGALTGTVRTLKEVEDGYIRNTNAYVQAVIQREAANKIAEKASETLIKINEVSAKSYEEYINTANVASNTFYKDSKENSANLIALKEEENRRIIEDAKNAKNNELLILQQNYQKQLDLVKQFSSDRSNLENGSTTTNTKADRSATGNADLPFMGDLDSVYSGLAAQRTKELADQIENLNKQYGNLKTTYGGGFITDAEIERQLVINSLFQQLSQTLTIGIAGALEQAMLNGQNFGKAMLQMLKQLIARLLAAAAAAALLAALVNIGTFGASAAAAQGGFAAGFGQLFSAASGLNLNRSASVAGVPVSPQGSGSVSFEIKGDKLYGVLQNYTERLDRIT